MTDRERPEDSMFPVPEDIADAAREEYADPASGEVITLESVMPNYPDRVQFVTHLANLYQRLKSERAAIEARYATIKQIIEDDERYIEKQLERCKAAFYQALPPSTGAECVANEYCSVMYTPSYAVEIEDLDSVPIEYTTLTTVVDKDAVRAAIESGKPVNGAKLHKRFNVQIKPGGTRAIQNAQKRAKKAGYHVNGTRINGAIS